MGKKTKVGKHRRDKFYHLAKETGFRSRSAFKLIQLNRKFEFLQQSRVLVDLCAAPGGWLQVSQKYMPVSSLIIGVDLVPIKPIPNVTTHQEDITTDKCKHTLKNELKTWKADVVLHDGAPNVGKNWIYDAFSQNQLTLSALKLASEFLTKGGWFVTKVFRSKDYHALLWVFKLLFKRVHATKPQASRHESAEIFVVCENYIAPAKIDPKFFNFKYLFEEVEPEPKATLNIFHPEKQKKRAEGYPEGDYTLYNKLNALEFIKSNNHIELLGKYNEITFDAVNIENHPLTTEEIKECCKDIKVLGKTDLKCLLTWRKKMKDYLEKMEKEASNDLDKKEENTPDINEEILEETIKLQKEQASELKRKKKKVLKQKRKLRERIDLKMVVPNDELLVQDDIELFRLEKIKKKEDLNKLDENDPSVLADDPDVEPNEKVKKKWSLYSRDEKPTDWVETEIEEDEGSELSFEEEITDDKEISNPLILDLEDKKKNAAERWFEKDIFNGLDDDDDDELELEFIPDEIKKNDKPEEPENDAEVSMDEKSVNEDMNTDLKFSNLEYGDKDSSDDDDDDDDRSDKDEKKAKNKRKKKKRIKLDPEGLALGTLMIRSQKTKRDIIDDAFNRYTFEDENLPDWFVKDEEKHYKKNIPVSQELIQEYKTRLKAINARPIKKIIEAKARKKKRALRKLEKARKKAETITDSLDMSEKEKAQHLTTIYKKALKKKDEKVTYVVAKKGMGRRVRRPAGVSGRFRVVDKRLKKDKRSIEALNKRKKKK